MTKGERRVARKLLTAIFNRGLDADIHDDPTICNATLAVERAKALGETATLRSMNSTGEDVVVVRDSYGVLLGWFRLIYGNDEDGAELIQDYSGTPLCESIFNEAFPA